MFKFASVLLALVALAAPASAGAVGIQSDEALKYDHSLFYSRADALGANWVRVMIPYNRWHDGEADTYVQAIADAKASGRNVMVSLFSWYVQPTPDQWRAFAQEVEPRLAPYVDAWSVMNEPDLPSMGPATPIHCEVSSQNVSTPVTSTVRKGVRIEYRYHRARNGHWSLRHHHWIKKRLRHHRHFRRTVRRFSLRRSHTIYVSSPSQRQTCSTEMFGVAYRAVWDKVAPVLAADDGAKLVMGDLAPAGDFYQFTEAFYSTGQPAVRPDVVASHYSTPDEAAGYTSWAHARGMEYWESEWGLVPWKYPNPSAQEWVDAYRAVRSRVDQLFVYDTGGGSDGWDTRIPDDAFDLLR